MPITDPLEHAHRILEVVQRGARNVTSDAVAQSWARCLNQHGLDPNQRRRPPVLGSAEFPGRRNRMADVIDCARYEMTTLYQQLGDAESAVVLTDTEGVILHMVSSQEFERIAQPLGLEVGAVWSEAEAGTNGMGTCVAEAGPVVVQQTDHFLNQYTNLTCSAVPVYDPEGEMTAVLDVSSRSTQAQQHLLVLLGMTARMIENRLMDKRFRNAHPVHFHSRPEFVYTLHEGKLVVDDEGRILAANRSALIQLGSSARELRSLQLDQIFQTTLDDMLQRSQRGAYHPIVVYRTNAAHRFFAVAQPPADDGEDDRGWVATPTLARLPVVRPAHVHAGASRPPALPRPVQSFDNTLTFGDPQLRAQLATARRVLCAGTPLLLRAETGAGKEVFARAVHASSDRADGAFVAINCASLPETLIEAELFGYRAGAFTGAERGGRRGKIAQADGGTLFLDEIGDMPLALQARLLRVLDERRVTPLGTEESRPVDFLLISASHRHLGDMVAEGAFREDLFYRLAGIELQLPAVRERSDRADLIRNLLVTLGRPDATVTPTAWDLLMSHPWPGNVRQLHHVLRSALALCDGTSLTLEHFPSLADGAARLGTTAVEAIPESEVATLSPEQLLERQALRGQLEALRWNVSHVAKALGISRNTLYRRMHKLRIPVTQNG
jgi:transcriptional regulator of acetoin/glycerol metabolism